MQDVFKSSEKISTDVQKQLGFPSGKKGIIIGKQLYKGNAFVIDESIRHIKTRNGIKICDIGCGPGYSLNKLSGKIKDGEIVGVDPSDEMCKMAEEYNKEAISSGLVKVIKGKTPNLPLDENYFDYVLLSNVVYFWKKQHLAKHFSELNRILKNEGKLIIYMTDRLSLLERIDESNGIFNMYPIQVIINVLSDTGFRVMDRGKFDRKIKEKGYIITASKSG